MKNVVKSTVVKSKERLLSGVLLSIRDVHLALNVLGSQVAQLQREQLKLSEQVDQDNKFMKERLMNSGAVRVSDTEIVAKLFSGLKIYLDPNDISLTPHVALDSVWEYHVTLAWLAVVKQHDVVIDVGANFGYFGALAAQVTDKKNSKVVFFEANPALIPYIQKTLSVNWLNEQSIVENLAVADKKGKVTLNVLKDYIASSSLHSTQHIDSYMHDKMKVETNTKVTVDAVTIDDYCRQNGIAALNLIKMDIEGYEDKAYEGMRNMIRKSPDVTLFIEFTRESYEHPKQFYETMLRDFGHVYQIAANGKLMKQKNATYEHVIGSPDDWVMPVFSKNAKLASA